MIVSTDRLLEKLREEDFVLWAGAGLSMYAGYPSGNQLATFINELLGPDKHAASASLDVIAGSYETKFGRHALLALLRKEFFERPPASIDYHLKLAVLPIFSAIVTTNYDLLFELAYNDTIVKICSVNDLIPLRRGQIPLFKIHGDFSQADKIVLSKNDYAAFLSNASQSLIYNSLLALLARNCVLFIGYSFEDINAIVAYNHVAAQLGDKRKEWWLVSPGLTSIQVKQLAERNIHVINQTGQEFIDALIKDFRHNIVKDHAKQRINTNQLTHFLLGHGVAPTITSTQQGDTITRIQSAFKEKKLTGNLKMQVAKDSSFYQQLNDFLNGKYFGDLSIRPDLIKEFAWEINDINFIDKTTLRELLLTSVPNIAREVTLMFGDRQIERTTFQLFISQNAMEVRLHYANLSIRSTATAPANQPMNTQITVDEIFPTALDGFLIYSLFTYAKKHEHFYMLLKDQKIRLGFSMHEKDDDCAARLEHFRQLLRIESFYGVQFKNIQLNAKDHRIAYRLHTLIEGTHKDLSPIEIVFEKNQIEKNFAQIKNKYTKPMPLTAEVPSEHATLYNIDLPIVRMRIEMKDAVLINAAKVINGQTEKMSFKSLSKKCFLQYIQPQ